MIGVVGVVAGIVLGLLMNGALMQVGMDFSAFSSMTEYTALINDRIYPSWGIRKAVRACCFRSPFLRAYGALPSLSKTSTARAAG